MSSIPVEYASQRKIRTRNKLYYRFNHWPIWIFVFFIAPGPLTFDLFERGFDSRMALWLGLVMLLTGIAGVRGKLPGVEPAPYIIRFTEDRPNPLYRRVCYTFAWSAAITFAVLNIAGLVVAIVTGQWYLKQIYRYAYFPIAGTIWLLGALGRLPRVMASTKGEGHERRYFYGTVWAMCLAQPALWLMWYVLPNTRVGQLAEAGDLSRHSRVRRKSRAARTIAAHAPDRSRRAGGVGLMLADRCLTKSQARQSKASKDDTRRLARLGRLRRFLRLGKRADARPPRREVLAGAWPSAPTDPFSSSGAAPGRVTIPVARTGARIVGVDRSSEMLGHALKRSRRARSHGAAVVAARRHPLPSVPRVRPVRSRHGAVRNPAVARPRIRSEGDAGVGRARARARRHLRRRSRARPAGVEGVPRQGALSRRAARRHVAHHARRIGAAGSREEADDLRPGVHRAARPRAHDRAAFRSSSARSRCRR